MPKRDYSIPELLRKQSRWCERLGSPLYAYLLAQSATDYEAHGPVRSLLAGMEADPPESALGLRFMSSIHRLVLRGNAPKLAKYYPSMGGDADCKEAWATFHSVVGEQRDALLPLVQRPVQTNEVGRCAALLPGFLEIARRTGLELRLLELGASAGLNLRWDQYRYEYSMGTWGHIDADVRIRDPQSEGNLPLDIIPKVSTRSGCDVDPIDPTTNEGQLTLKSYIWADQTQRFELLRSALNVAQRVPCKVQCARAGDWIVEELGVSTNGVCSVVFHSIVLQYLSETERDQVESAIQRGGETASDLSPLAWLRMEPGRDEIEVRVYDHESLSGSTDSATSFVQRFNQFTRFR